MWNVPSTGCTKQLFPETPGGRTKRRSPKTENLTIRSNCASNERIDLTAGIGAVDLDQVVWWEDGNWGTLQNNP